MEWQKIELDGTRYVILRESAFEELCLAAGVPLKSSLHGEAETLESSIGLDRVPMAERIKRRRQSTGLSQAELARRAGVRPETLNRIERGRTTPDFSTVRKLVIAMNTVERESVKLTVNCTERGSCDENE